MANQNTTGIRRIIKAFSFSMQGLKATWKHEAAFRQEVLLCSIATPLAFWLGQTVVEKLLLLGSLMLVLLVELINSALEAIVDRVGYEHHELSGRAKDIGSAAVFLTLCWAGLTWLFILID